MAGWPFPAATPRRCQAAAPRHPPPPLPGSPSPQASSSSPRGQSVAPSQTLDVLRHRPSSQAKCPGHGGMAVEPATGPEHHQVRRRGGTPKGIPPCQLHWGGGHRGDPSRASHHAGYHWGEGHRGRPRPQLTTAVGAFVGAVVAVGDAVAEVAVGDAVGAVGAGEVSGLAATGTAQLVAAIAAVGFAVAEPAPRRALPAPAGEGVGAARRHWVQRVTVGCPAQRCPSHPHPHQVPSQQRARRSRQTSPVPARGLWGRAAGSRAGSPAAPWHHRPSPAEALAGVVSTAAASAAAHPAGLSSQPSRQSWWPSQTVASPMQEPSGQGSCPGAQVTRSGDTHSPMG